MKSRAVIRRAVNSILSLVLIFVAACLSPSAGVAWASAGGDVALTNSVSAEVQGAPTAATGKWIDVNLRTQKLTAYQGNKLVYTTIISSGTKKYPTVTGTYYIYSKLKSQRMRGGTGRDRYDLPNVPHVMYFHQGYAIHGTYWHNNFGRPMSHGCVNANKTAAAWLYNWAHVGTPVKVHY